MAILNMFNGGGGVRIPLQAPTNLSGYRSLDDDITISLTWTDPVDKVTTPGGEVAAAWVRSVVIRKKGSAPTSPYDGTIVLQEYTRNQHATTPYTEEVPNDDAYYYAVYAVTKTGIFSSLSNILEVKQRIGRPVFYENRLSVLPRGYCPGYYRNAAYAGAYLTFQDGGGDTRACSSSLTFTDLTNLVLANNGDGCASASFKGKAVYAGGKTGASNTYGDNNVVIYSETLSRSTNTALSLINGSRYGSAACTENHLVINGGQNNSGNISGDRSVAFTENFTGTVMSGFAGRVHASSNVINGFAIFAGGGPGSTVQSVNDALTVSSMSGLRSSVNNPASAANNNYILFVAGQAGTSDNDRTSIATAYDKDLVRHTAPNFKSNNAFPFGCKFGNYAMVTGNPYRQTYNLIDIGYYDEDLTFTDCGTLSKSLSAGYPVGGSIGEYCIFIGYYGAADYEHDGHMDVYVMDRDA